MRVKITLAYNGTYFLGSQTQIQTQNTVLGTLERVLKKLGIQEKLIASGRTDKGVHASGQVCHLDLPPFWNDTKRLHRVLNEMLASSISIKRIEKVEDAFHARYDARVRTYRYIIKESESNPFEANFVTFLRSFSFEKVQKNIQLFEGVHNFAFFMKNGSDVHSTTREIYRAFAYQYQGYTILNFQANGFLRSQIRLMVAALLRLDAKEIVEKLECKTEHKVKPAPPNGLYLAKIKY